MYRCLAVALILAAIMAQPAAALEIRGGPLSRLEATETIDDDLYIAAGRVNVDGRVKGDVIAAGGTVRIRGQVDGDALIAGGTVEVTGRVGETIRALAEAVGEAAQAAAQIVASAGQQAVGMGQVRQAMASIHEATQQNLASTKQAERAAQDLNALGTKLLALVGGNRHAPVRGANR